MSDDEWNGVDFDCLGCMLEAKAKGTLAQADYDAFFETVKAEQDARHAPCPKCGEPAYISEYEPDLMHCSACGLYSHREHFEAPWQPFAQGACLDARAAARGARAAQQGMRESIMATSDDQTAEATAPTTAEPERDPSRWPNPEKPTVGRIVHYVLDSGEHRPAIIVRVWGREHHSSVQLQVFTDGTNDYRDLSECNPRGAVDAETAPPRFVAPGTVWRTSVGYCHQDANKPGTFHWPERD